MLILEFSILVISILDIVGVFFIIGQIDDYKSNNFVEKIMVQVKDFELFCLIIDLLGVFFIDIMMMNELF